MAPTPAFRLKLDIPPERFTQTPARHPTSNSSARDSRKDSNAMMTSQSGVDRTKLVADASLTLRKLIGNDGCRKTQVSLELAQAIRRVHVLDEFPPVQQKKEPWNTLGSDDARYDIKFPPVMREPSAIHDMFAGNYKLISVLMHCARQRQMHSGLKACAPCQENQGHFVDCVTIMDEGGVPIANGACTNCLWQNKFKKCNLSTHATTDAGIELSDADESQEDDEDETMDMWTKGITGKAVTPKKPKKKNASKGVQDIGHGMIHSYPADGPRHIGDDREFMLIEQFVPPTATVAERRQIRVEGLTRALQQAKYEMTADEDTEPIPTPSGTLVGTTGGRHNLRSGRAQDDPLTPQGKLSAKKNVSALQTQRKNLKADSSTSRGTVEVSTDEELANNTPVKRRSKRKADGSSVGTPSKRSKTAGHR